MVVHYMTVAGIRQSQVRTILATEKNDDLNTLAANGYQYEGQGKSKLEAQNAAAKKALRAFGIPH